MELIVFFSPVTLDVLSLLVVKFHQRAPPAGPRRLSAQGSQSWLRRRPSLMRSGETSWRRSHPSKAGLADCARICAQQGVASPTQGRFVCCDANYKPLLVRAAKPVNNGTLNAAISSAFFIMS